MSRFWAARRVEGLDPLSLLETAGSGAGSCYLRNRGLFGEVENSGGLELAGIGEALVLEASGPERLNKLSREATQAYQQLVEVGGELGSKNPFAPLFVGGFSFDPNWNPEEDGCWMGFAPARLVLPELTLRTQGSQGQLLAIAPEGMTEQEASSWLARRLDAALTALQDQGSVLGETQITAGKAAESGSSDVFESEGQVSSGLHYEEQVRSALSAIASGSLTKVAVARSELLDSPVPVELPRLLATLRERFSNCYIFCVEPAGADAFVGASPEQLLSCGAGKVWADALAGTAGRGSNPREDDELGLALMESSKERSEHEVVVRYLRKTLTPVTSSLEASDVPGILRLANVQHLHTPFRGELKNGEGVLDLVRRIHPTPAVAGMPRDEALRWLTEEERLDRGWYAGGVGFVGPAGGGTFCVAIRSGLVAGDTVRLFAGAGIVEGSQPEHENVEVERKLAGLKEALFHA